MQSGIGRYLREILSRMLRDPGFERFLLLGTEAELREFLAPEPRSVARRVEIVSFPYRFYSLRAQAHWGWLAARGSLRAEVSFFPHYDVPVWPPPARTVVTVQDLTHFRLPELFSAWKRIPASAVLARAVRQAERVLVTSEATRRDLLARHPDVASRVVSIPLGVDPSQADLPAKETAGRFRIEALRPFVLCVGNRKPHKNLGAAVEAIHRLRGVVPELRLVVAGQEFHEGDEVRARAEELGISDAVVELGAVPDPVLRGLYRAAECLLFPSLHEGFGLPLLEAMAFGTPVVASNRASVPEVVGDAGLLVDPLDYDAFAAATARILKQPLLRAELVERGRQRAARFTWDETARLTVEVIRDAASPSRAGSHAR